MLKEGAFLLEKKGIETPLREARLIAASILGISYEDIYFNVEKTEAPQDFLEKFHAILQRRLAKEPLTKIFGQTHFWDFQFDVNIDTLDPRPETELVVEKVLDFYPQQGSYYRILDLGTGTGCILGTLLKLYPQSIGIGVDLNQRALETAKKNIGSLGVLDRCKLIQGYWTEALIGAFDIIVTNPPYIGSDESLDDSVINYDPAMALFSPCNGLLSYREILEKARWLMHDSSQIFFEIGHKKMAAVNGLLKDHYVILDVARDLQGIERVVIAKKACPREK